MLKYANYDIENGLKSLKIGFGAIFNALINKEIEVYQTEFPLSPKIVELGIELYYHDDSINLIPVKADYSEAVVENITILFEIDRTVFYRLPSKT